jgi:hypothetical protein
LDMAARAGGQQGDGSSGMGEVARCAEVPRGAYRFRAGVRSNVDDPSVDQAWMCGLQFLDHGHAGVAWWALGALRPGPSAVSGLDLHLRLPTRATEEATFWVYAVSRACA